MNRPANRETLVLGLFRSGVAARESGVAVNTLRVWERRYGVVGPSLSNGGQRLYSTADIRRLSAIKQLVDMGHPIGVIASLGAETLSDMLRTTESLHADPLVGGIAARELRIAMAGHAIIPVRAEATLFGLTFKIVGQCTDLTKAASSLAEASADLLIITVPTPDDTSLATVSSIKAACGAASALLLYRYAPSAVIRRLRLAGHAVARATADAQEIEAICWGLARRSGLAVRNGAGMQTANEPNAPRYDESTLVEFSKLSRTVECECPRHLADLVISLVSFERYSANCANRSPSDAALHFMLQRAAGTARAILEQALGQLASAEGIDLPTLTQ